MSMFIKELLAPDILDTLTSTSDPGMIQQENIAQAARQLVKTIGSLELYPVHQALIDRFEELRKKHPALYTHRTFFLWEMAQAVFELTSLNLHGADFLASNSLKCQAGVLTVVFDDICDLGTDQTVFHKAVLALQGQIDSDNIETCQFIADTWAAFQSSITQTPNFELLKPTLEEAYQHWIASFEYSIWLRGSSRFEEKWENHLEMISHSMTLYLAGLIDLLFVPNLSTHQAAAAAKIFVRTQKMAEIGNWKATWPRELAQRDFTSGVFTIALQNHWVDWEDLNSDFLEMAREKIQNSPVEEYLWAEWERLRVESNQIVQDAQLPALNGYVESFSAIMFMLIAGTGMI